MTDRARLITRGPKSGCMADGVRVRVRDDGLVRDRGRLNGLIGVVGGNGSVVSVGKG